MLKKKSNGSEKKRKHSQSEERRENNKRRSAESNQEEVKDELADAELDRIGSDIEEGGLDLSMPFQPITAYVGDRREMLEQCFRVLGEKKLQKMLPDELKGCSFEEIKTLCWEQLEQVSLKNLLQILAGEDLTPGDAEENTDETSESQQDSNVDSTSCLLKESAKTESEDPKQEAGGSGEESDVLSINADTYDSDIEGPKEEQSAKAAEAPLRVEGSNTEGTDPTAKPAAANPEIVKDSKPVEAKKDIQMDIDRSVSEILAFSNTLNQEEADKQSSTLQASASAAAASVPAVASVSAPAASVSAAAAAPPAEGGSSLSRAPAPGQPSVQQLELLELEMRARAIKALMKASNGKKNPEAN